MILICIIYGSQILEAKSRPAESIRMNIFTPGESVLDDRPVATGSVARSRRSGTAAGGSGIQISIRQFFHPSVLAFLALALTVGASGYGYKLSHYFHHAGVSKAYPTRMWVEHRDESVGAQAKQSVKPLQIPGPALFAAPAPRVLRLSRDHVIVTSAPPRVALLISSQVSFRGPPSFHLSLA